MESYTKRCRPLQLDLVGFWKRGIGTTLVGTLKKYVANDKNKKPFFIFQVSLNGTVIVVDRETERVAEIGEFVGVSANWSITSVIDKVTDIGKCFRLTVTEEVQNPHGGVPMKIIDVEDVNEQAAPF